MLKKPHNLKIGHPGAAFASPVFPVQLLLALPRSPMSARWLNAPLLSRDFLKSSPTQAVPTVYVSPGIWSPWH